MNTPTASVARRLSVLSLCTVAWAGCGHLAIKECHIESELWQGRVLHDPPSSPIGILLLATDAQNQRAMLQVTNAAEGRAVSGWVNANSYAAFSAQWTGISGLKVKSIRDHAVVIERAYAQ